MNATEEYSYYNRSNAFNGDQTWNVIAPLILIICCIGLQLNGIVIWILGFQIKRNPFTVLILNLAISDFGVLIFMPIISTRYFIDEFTLNTHKFPLYLLFDIMYINGLFLLTAISIDRCVCVLLPIWYRCSRPKFLSPAVCAFLWTISFLLSAIQGIMEYALGYFVIISLHFLVTALLCLPWMTISTVVLFINLCLRPQQVKPGRVLVMILIALFCFLILSFPLYGSMFLSHFFNIYYFWTFPQFPLYFSLSICLNSSVNPMIYFLVGRKKRAGTKESIKVMFQRVFREDETPETR